MELVARSGETRTGLPVAHNAAPPPHQAGVIGRYYITAIDQPADRVTEDILLSETAMMRILVRGEWEWFKRNVGWIPVAGAMLCGAERRGLKVRCRGPMAVAGFAIRPGGWPLLMPHSHAKVADQIVRVDGDWGTRLEAAAADIDDHTATIARLTAAVEARLPADRTITPLIERFETIAREQPTRAVADIAAELGVTPRRLDTLVRAHFGHLPKTILRRSRFLDMAAVMRGLAVADEETLAGLRFYDRSHRNLEFRQFVDMTPAAFERARTPLLTAGIEVRQQRKLADAHGGVAAPWLAPG